jgi:TonB family protein
MSCNDIASVLDSHDITRLGPAERAHVDAHLAACADCAAAWRAQTELLALPVPPVPATLLERALLASRVPQSAPARRARMPFVVGSVLLAGAALAAGVTVVSLLHPASAPTPSAASAEQPTAQPATNDEQLEQTEPKRAEAQSSSPVSVELVEAALSIAPIVRRPPDYPLEALKQRLGGHVQVEFDVSAAGVVENVRVVESSDPLFEDSAVRAVSTWRYLPRIVAGKRVAAKDVHTILRYAPPGADDPPPDQRRVDAKQEAAMREFRVFSNGLEVALDRLAADDFRGVELQLDEMQAIYGPGRADLWSFYGYLYTVQGNYDRAIDAYERSVAVHERSPQPGTGPWVPLANLYFARHQYDVALKTLLRPRQATNGAAPPGGSRLVGGEAEALIERLRALGVTEETL